ncbi:hypothetical protein ACFFNY_26105 [Paenibacillus hodogayensis]|uniref:Uncharacterized protein n=1 Tax=Paenibacillus hodogayensis TaxID=279208 RepID=A0ABV5W3D4_9BACL
MVRIRFESIEIDTVSESSSVNSGINVLLGRVSTERSSEAMGSVDGKGNKLTDGLYVRRRRADDRPNGGG